MTFGLRHVGSSFDPVRYEEIEEKAQLDYLILEGKIKEAAEDSQEEPRNNWAFKLRIKISPVLKRWKKKTRTLLRRLIPRNRRHSTQTTQTPPEQWKGSGSGASIQSITPETPEKVLFPAAPGKKAILVEEHFSEEEKEYEEFDNTPRRYKHMYPSEEKMPPFEIGKVSRLARCIAPLFSGQTSSSDSLSHFGSNTGTGSGKSENTQKLQSLEDKRLELRKSRTNRSSSKGSSLKLQSSNFTNSSEDKDNINDCKRDKEISNEPVEALGSLNLKSGGKVTECEVIQNCTNVRAISLLPCEEPRPLVQPGHVKFLASIFERNCQQ